MTPPLCRDATLRLAWADTPATRPALTTLLATGAAAISHLFSLVTTPGSPLTFRYCRTAPGPPAPWFHPGPLDGIVTDYMMKTRASSGRDGTLSLYAATDLRLLAEHSQALLLPHPGDPSAPPALYWIRSPT